MLRLVRSKRSIWSLPMSCSRQGICFFDLTPEESVIVEIRLALSRGLKERRKPLMTQAELAALAQVSRELRWQKMAIPQSRLNF
jgi:hypothetical protein